jgi:hypothetical protein
MPIGYNTSVDNIVLNVRDIDSRDRQSLEHVLGLPLSEHQQVVIRVVDAQERVSSAAEPGSAGEQPDSKVPEWWKVYEGLSDEEVDRLDQAIRQRANLTRIFE